MKYIVSCYVVLSILLTGCSSSFEGEYIAEDCLFLEKMVFNGKDTVYVTGGAFGMKNEKAGTYKIDGDKINILIDQKSTVFTKQGDNISGDFGVKCTLTKITETDRVEINKSPEDRIKDAIEIVRKGKKDSLNEYVLKNDQEKIMDFYIDLSDIYKNNEVAATRISPQDIRGKSVDVDLSFRMKSDNSYKHKRLHLKKEEGRWKLALKEKKE